MEHGLALVDVGFGTEDLAQPRARLGLSARSAGASLDPTETALHQLHSMGFGAADVTDIISTHLDYDHIGGLSDFPDARLHVTALELREARSPTSATRAGRARYRRAHIDAVGNASGYTDFETTVIGLTARAIDTSEQIFLVPMPGHTAGHAAVAVHDPARGWLLHAGDAFLHRSALDGGSRTFTPRAVGALEHLMASQNSKLRANHLLLREVASSGVHVFCSHDREQWRALH